jgi:transposase-like protein
LFGKSKERGLTTVELALSEAHELLATGIEAALSSFMCQLCQTYFMRRALDLA